MRGGTRPYTPEQVRALLAAAAAAAGERAGWLLARRDHAMMAVGYYAGARAGGLRRLRVGALDAAGATLTVVGKGGRQRTVTIPPVAVAILTGYRTDGRGPAGPEDLPCCERDNRAGGEPGWAPAGEDLTGRRGRAMPSGQPLRRRTRGTVNAVVRRYGWPAGLDGPPGPHRLRDTHAAAGVAGGMSVEALAHRFAQQVSPGRNGDPVALDSLHLDHVQRAAGIAQAFPHRPVAAGGPAAASAAEGRPGRARPRAGAELCSREADDARFAGLRWRDPLR